MKVLLDECLPLDFRHSFPNHDAHTVQWAGLKGKQNGELLQAAETELLPLVEAILRALETIQPGETAAVPS
jgi:predicted nuclease of predicted toxin-antitoxin system